MHPCLQVTDILHLIFQDVSAFKGGHTLKLALTCQHFKHHALSLIWKSLESLLPLLKTMPSDLWQMQGYWPETFEFVRKPKPDDWEAFDRYAPYVEELGNGDCESSMGSCVSRKVYEELKKRNPHVLLPNLSRIYCQQAWLVDLDILPCFMTDRVTYLNIHAHPSCLRGLEIASQAWNALATRSPFIEHLVLGGRYRDVKSWNEESKYLGDFIKGLEHLKTFECPSYRLHDDTIHYLISLPKIRTLQFRITGPQALNPPHSSPAPQLQALESLHLKFDYIHGGIAAVLQSLNSPAPLSRIRSLTISSYRGSIPIETLEEILLIVKDNHDRSLFLSFQLLAHTHEFEVDHDIPNASDAPELTADSPVITVQASIFKPLFDGYSSLAYIVLERHLLDASDTQVGEIAAHLPSLRIFHLASEPDGVDLEPKMTLRSVLSFLTNCPFLEELSLYIEAKVDSWSPTSSLQDFSHEIFRSLHLGSSPVESFSDAQIICNLVESVCPNFYRIFGVYWKQQDDTGEEDYYESDETDYSLMSLARESGFLSG